MKTTCDEMKIVCDGIKSFLASLPKEIYYRYKYPKIIFEYIKRVIPKIGSYNDDTRNFFNTFNVSELE